MFLDWTEKDVTYWGYIRLLQSNTANRERLILGKWIMGLWVLTVLMSFGQVGWRKSRLHSRDPNLQSRPAMSSLMQGFSGCSLEAKLFHPQEASVPALKLFQLIG